MRWQHDRRQGKSAGSAAGASALAREFDRGSHALTLQIAGAFP
jgi:hypothetical protein